MKRKNETDEKDSIELLLKDRFAKPGPDCEQWESLIYDYALSRQGKKDNGLSEREQTDIKKHIENCPHCFYLNLEYEDEIKAGASAKEKKMIKALLGRKRSIKDFLGGLLEKADDFIVGIFPAPPALQLRDKNEEIGRFKKTAPVEYILNIQREAGYDLLLISEDPDGKKKVFYPHTFWGTERGMELMSDSAQAISFKLRSADNNTKTGEWRFLVFQVKGLGITPFDKPFDNEFAHNRKSEEILEAIEKQAAKDKETLKCSVKRYFVEE